MRIDIPKIVKPIKLSEYAEEFGDEVIYVWVNPPRRMLMDIAEWAYEAERIRERMRQGEAQDGDMEKLAEIARQIERWHAEIWSCGPEEKRWTADEIEILIENSMDTDPNLWKWLTEKTLEMIGEHRETQKKRAMMPSTNSPEAGEPNTA